MKAKSTEKPKRNPRLKPETWDAIRLACTDWELQDPLFPGTVTPQEPDDIIMAALNALGVKHPKAGQT